MTDWNVYKRDYLWLIWFSITFLCLTYIESKHLQVLLDLPWYIKILFVFAVSRLGRAISGDIIFVWLQSLVCKISPSGTGAGDEIDPTGTGLHWALSNLIACPICAGTWAAEALVLVTILDPAWGQLLIIILGSIGAAELWIRLVELIQWRARCAREEVGKCEVARNGK